MNNKSSKITILVMVTLAFLFFIPKAQCQEGMELINQLSEKVEAPARNPEQLAETYQKAIDYLMPFMMAQNVPSQYEPQIHLQNLGSHASRPGAEVERQALAKVMIKTLEEKEMPNTLRNWFVLQLERIGKAESVPILTKLLSNKDKHLRDYARRALEKNPDTSATEALLKELGSARESAWKIGLINSLGERKAEAAISAIVKALDDSDTKVASAAVTALSDIGNQACIQALTEVLDKSSSPVYLKTAQGLIDIAQAKAMNKQISEAGKIFDSIYEITSKNIPGGPDMTSVRIASINGMINCYPDKGATLIVNFIKDENPKIRSAAVMGAGSSSSDAPIKALGAILTQLEPDTQIQVLGVIGDRKDLSSINAVKETIKSQNPEVRLASIDTMSKLGDAASADALFNIAVNGSGSEKAAAHNGLVQMNGTNVGILVNTKALSGDIPSRLEAISLIGEKHMTDSTKNLLTFASENNGKISSAALEALAETADESSIPILVSLISKFEVKTAQESGVNTLKSILLKAKDKDTAAQSVIEQMEKSNEEIKLVLLTSLSSVGSSKALAAVTEAVNSSDETMKDKAVRTLCEWPDYEATKELLNIASNSDSSVLHHVLSIRGILQLIQDSSSVPLEERVDLCLSTYGCARRDEEKGQVISAMATLPTSKITAKLIEIAKDNELNSEAGSALVRMVTTMVATNRQAAQSLAQEIIDQNISDELNTQIQNALITRGRGNFGNFGNRGRNQRDFRSVIVRPDKETRLASIKEIEIQIEALKAAIEKAPDEEPNLANLEGTALREAIEVMQPEMEAINVIQTTLASLRGNNGGSTRGGRGGMIMGGMGSTASTDVLSELRVIANDEKATKTVARLDILIKEAQTQTGRRGGMGGGIGNRGAGGMNMGNRGGIRRVQ